MKLIELAARLEEMSLLNDAIVNAENYGIDEIRSYDFCGEWSDSFTFRKEYDEGITLERAKEMFGYLSNLELR